MSNSDFYSNMFSINEKKCIKFWQKKGSKLFLSFQSETQLNFFFTPMLDFFIGPI